MTGQESPQKSSFNLPIATALCFAAALTLCLAQSLSRATLETAWIFDSGRYMRSSQQVQSAILQLGHHFDIESLKQIGWHLKQQLLVDGPILPSLGAAVFILLHRSISLNDVAVFIVLQSFLHALSAALVCVIAARLTGSRKWGLASGLIWSCYPPAVIATGKFLSETLTTDLLLSLTLAIACFNDSIAARRSAWTSSALAIASGILTGCIMLTKPALAPIAVVLNLFVLRDFDRGKLRLLMSSCLLVATAIVIVPWAAFTKMTTGHVALTNVRYPTYNFAFGFDRESDAWGCVPNDSFVNLFPASDPAFATLLGICMSERQDAFNLMLRKAPRLLGSPWNDFRAKFLGLPPASLVWWHQVLALFGLYGLLLFMSAPPSGNSAEARTARCLGYIAAAMIAGHASYLLVMTGTRYGFTAMPFLALFAGYALAAAFASRRKKATAICLAAITALLLLAFHADLIPWFSCFNHDISGARLCQAVMKSALACLALLGLFWTAKAINPEGKLSAFGVILFGATALLFTAVFAAQALSDRELIEWKCELEPGESANRSIFIDMQQAPTVAMVLFDGDIAGNAAISVNGVALSDRARSIYSLRPDGQDHTSFQMYSSLIRVPQDELRQWWIAPVPVRQLNLHGRNIISISANAGSTVVYGSYPTGPGDRLRIPALTQTSMSKLLMFPDNCDARLLDWRTVNTAGSTSWYAGTRRSGSGDLSPSGGAQFGQYRLFLMLKRAGGRGGASDITSGAKIS